MANNIARKDYELLYAAAFRALRIEEAGKEGLDNIHAWLYSKPRIRKKNDAGATGRRKGHFTGLVSEDAKIINRLIKSGMTQRSIAEVLDKSVSSISSHVKRHGLPREDWT